MVTYHAFYWFICTLSQRICHIIIHLGPNMFSISNVSRLLALKPNFLYSSMIYFLLTQSVLLYVK